MSDWPFADSPNCVVFTAKQIIREGARIAFVTHDVEDGCWHFMEINPPKKEDAMMVSLEAIAKIDPSILALADLPLGWCALRVEPDDTWRRAKRHCNVVKRTIADSLETEKVEGQEELWSVPQYGLLTLLGIVTGVAVLFSFFMTLHIHWFEGLFGAVVFALLAWIVIGVCRMVNLPSQKSQNQEDPQASTDDHKTGDMPE
jgi:hypothetical protein